MHTLRCAFCHFVYAFYTGREFCVTGTKIDNRTHTAITIVKRAIKKREEQLRAYTTAEHEGIEVMGETTMGYLCTVVADPKEISKIMLKYDEPTWSVLEEDCPDSMWMEIAKTVGLELIDSVDI